MSNLMKQTKEESFFRCLLNYVPTKKSKFFLTRLIMIFLFLSMDISGTNLAYESLASDDKRIELEKNYTNNYIKNIRSKVYEKLLDEVTIYMHAVSPNSKLDPELVTKKCLDHNMNIVFVLAQGVLESNLGTRGKAIETNSVWNVGSYDNGIIRYKYDTPNGSINPYLLLLKNKYLIDISQKGDTIHKGIYYLLQDKGYKNLNGQRYATDPSYEDNMRKLILKIDMKTSINFYQNLYKMPSSDVLSYFAPDEKIDKNNSIL